MKKNNNKWCEKSGNSKLSKNPANKLHKQGSKLEISGHYLSRPISTYLCPYPNNYDHVILQFWSSYSCSEGRTAGIMANDNGIYGVKFIWKIINFSGIKSGILQSPSFPWKSTTWEVMIYLTDVTTGGDSFSAELNQIIPKYLNMCCSLAFLDSQGFPLVWKEKAIAFGVSASNNNSVKFSNLIKKKDIFGSRRNEFLPNDILTLQCHIWELPHNHLFSEHVPLLAHTQIEPLLKITKRSFIWDVTDSVSLRYNFQQLERMESMTINGKPLVMRMVMDHTFKVTITVSLFQIHLKITISLLNTSGEIKQLIKEEFPFEKNRQEWNSGTILTKNMLACHTNDIMHDDTLLLHFSCTLSGNITFNSLVEEDEVVNIVLPNIDSCRLSEPADPEHENETLNRMHHSDTALKALQGMYEEGFLSDFDLKAGGRSFPVHKNVLGMRSPVFRAMFTTEMTEKENNCSVIEDVDGDTLQRLLQFIYTDHVEEDMGWESASGLYEAADKYALETLKQKCSFILRSEVCPDSVLDTLKLADMHNDQELKTSAFEFISMHDKEIVGSERWKKFEEENNKLAFDTFRNLYLYFKNMIR